MNVFVKILKAIQWLMAVNSMYWLKVVLLNLAAGDGHPAEIMDLSFAMQAIGC